MSVSPFCELPMNAKKTVIVTYQTTSYDDEATIKIHANCDDVMRYIVNDIEEYDYKIDFKCEIEKNKVKLVSGYENEPLKIVENAWIYLNNEKFKMVEKSDFFEKEVDNLDTFELEVEFLEKFNIENLKTNINSLNNDTKLFMIKNFKL
jgi:hypothetical protein